MAATTTDEKSTMEPPDIPTTIVTPPTRETSTVTARSRTDSGLDGDHVSPPAYTPLSSHPVYFEPTVPESFYESALVDDGKRAPGYTELAEDQPPPLPRRPRRPNTEDSYTTVAATGIPPESSSVPSSLQPSISNSHYPFIPQTNPAAVLTSHDYDSVTYSGSEAHSPSYPPPFGTSQTPGAVSATPLKLSMLSRVTKRANGVAHLVGSEGPLPTKDFATECAKAARILHSFTSVPAPVIQQASSATTPPTSSTPRHLTGVTAKSLYKIPLSVLRKCAGLAIFSSVRAGFIYTSLAGGSGVLLARVPDPSDPNGTRTTWSPPAAFHVGRLGAGFLLGFDLHECVCVLHTPEQVRKFASHTTFSLGGDVGIAVGPLGGGANIDSGVGVHKARKEEGDHAYNGIGGVSQDQNTAVSRTETGKYSRSKIDTAAGSRPVWSYMKSRGLWAGVQVDGTVIVMRPETSKLWYGNESVKDIMEGKARWKDCGESLKNILQAIDGDRWAEDVGENFVEPGWGETVGNPATVPTSGSGALGDPTAQRMPQHGVIQDEEKARLAASGY